MPFTFSHPAIVLPLTYLPKKWFSLTGLIIGSLVPDFEYFLRMKLKSTYSHTLFGIFWFDLPLALLLAFIFHNLVRDTLFDHLPHFLKARFVAFKQFNWSKYFETHWIVVFLSIIIGAVSHIFWDSFTHEQGYFVQTVPTLSQTITFQGIQVPLFKLLQHVSSIIGLMAIAACIKKLPKSNYANRQNTNLEYWTLIAAFAFVIVTIKFLLHANNIQIGNLVVIIISGALFSLIATSFLLRLRKIPL